MESPFQTLCDDLPMVREVAAALESPNTQDDLPIKIAIAGYSYHRSPEHWGEDEFDFVALRRREVEDFGPPWVELVCLVTGYLLGLYQDGRIDEAELALHEAQLPGFMWLHSDRFIEV